MEGFYEVIENIYRLKIPFDNIYTSVFLIKLPTGAVLVDCATTNEDVENYILPSLERLGYTLEDIRALVLSHNHSDHAGGLSAILHYLPSIHVVREEMPMFNGLEIYPLAGHTFDMIGVFDRRTGTLISGDGLQGAGVDKYRCSLASKDGYLKTLENIKEDERIKNILFSHAYEPWNCDHVFGRESVLKCIDECKKYIGEN